MPDNHPMPPLAASAQIIEDQGDHVVVAIRVPKATIAENIAFMGALGDRTAPTKPLPVSLAAPRARRSLGKVLACGAGVTLVAGTLFISSSNARPPEPFVFYALAVDDARGEEPLQLTIHAHRRRLCQTDMDRMILDDREVPIWRDRVHGMARVVTKEPTIRQMPLPQPTGLQPGAYTYRLTVHNDCGQQQFSTAAEAHFTIRP